jgi:hypothetical protein
MTTQLTATLQGHPWDLWGLSRLFDGSDTRHTLVMAEKPTGRPTYDTSNKDAINRFRIQGYDVFATLTSEELLAPGTVGAVDLRDIRPVALELVERINGIAILLDPDYRPAKLLSLTYSYAGGSGSTVLGDWTPNRDMTFLSHHPLQGLFAKDILPLALSDNRVKFVLDAIALPRSWASLYLIYDAIAADVGGVHELRKSGWVTLDELNDFTNSANNSRNIREGARHGKDPDPGRRIIPLVFGYTIINRLAVRWLDWVRGGRPA